MVLSIAGTGADAQIATRITSSSGLISVVRRTSATFTPTPTNTSPMQGAQTCPTAAAPGDVRYRSGVLNGKQSLDALLPYGKGGAIYHLERQP